ncbi:MAG: alpha/beta hydrolase [Propionibacteriaceae bacterium]|nr:alpha/beta hydrolase [Propionibacteriaceae bacterium]
MRRLLIGSAYVDRDIAEAVSGADRLVAAGRDSFSMTGDASVTRSHPETEDWPERVQGLALLGAPGNALRCRPPWPLRLTAIRGPNRALFARVVPKRPDASLRGLKLMGHGGETIGGLPPAIVECYFRFQRLPHYETSSLSLMETANTWRGSKRAVWIGPDDLRRVRAPTLLIWGENDPFGSVRAGLEIQRALPDAAFGVVPRAGHLPWLDDPTGCAEKVTAFLDALPGAARAIPPPSP